MSDLSLGDFNNESTSTWLWPDTDYDPQDGAHLLWVNGQGDGLHFNGIHASGFKNGLYGFGREVGVVGTVEDIHGWPTGVGVLGDGGSGGTGVVGRSSSGDGVDGISESSDGVFGQSSSGNGVQGQSDQGAGVFGWANSEFGGVQGGSDTSFGVVGISQSGHGVDGSSQSSYGVSGWSKSSHGVHGWSDTGAGVVGVVGTSGPGVRGHTKKGQGVLGVSQDGTGVVGIGAGGQVGRRHGPGTGVAGYANAGIGVFGSCESGVGVYGTSTLGVAGSFDGIAWCQNNAEGYALVGANPDKLGYGCTGITSDGCAIVGIVTTELGGTGKGKAGCFRGPVEIDGPLVVKGTLQVTGTKHAALAAPDGSHRLLYCMESTESWFEDFGEVRLVKGHKEVTLDPIFAGLVDTRDYHVFLTPHGDCLGLHVSRRGPTSFTVTENQGGQAAISFSYRIVARRKDVEAKRLPKVKAPEPAAPLPDLIQVPTPKDIIPKVPDLPESRSRPKRVKRQPPKKPERSKHAVPLVAERKPRGSKSKS
jgi:hypothetical protein